MRAQRQRFSNRPPSRIRGAGPQVTSLRQGRKATYVTRRRPRQKHDRRTTARQMKRFEILTENAPAVLVGIQPRFKARERKSIGCAFEW